MELITVLEMAKDCNAKTLGQAIGIIRENQQMLFEYEDRVGAIQQIISDIRKCELKLSDSVDKCLSKLGQTQQDSGQWWNLVAI